MYIRTLANTHLNWGTIPPPRNFEAALLVSANKRLLNIFECEYETLKILLSVSTLAHTRHCQILNTQCKSYAIIEAPRRHFLL